jgi:hypothetical protein
MTVNCRDRERIFEDGSPAEWAALEAHAQACASCSEEILAWKAISVAAGEMRDYSPSPALWVRMERALDAQAQEIARRSARRAWLRNWKMAPVWQVAAAGALALLLAVLGVRLYVGKIEPPSTDAHLLKNQTLAEVERTESAYMQAIDKLAAEAKPQLEDPETPLHVSYKEKLLVIDSAIDDLRTQAGLNPSNAHVRYQLLAMYQEKQHTLEEVLEMKK